jgi:putative FmdB family regulatory protein
MPIYEYECKACGAHHEAMQKMSDGPLRKCPACGRQRLVRVLSAPVFRLKGGGWYETDFKSDAEGKRNLHAEDKADKPEAAAKADKSEAADTAAKAEKPDAKAGAAAPAIESAKTAATAAAKTPAKRPASRRPRRRGTGARRR